MTGRYNLLFILTDQQSATMMSCAGNSYLQTPAIDSIAAGGVRFERAYCTNPVCIPSRFSLMTGLMPSTIGMISNYVAHIEAIPEHIKRNGLGWLLRRSGYDVAYAGKVHLPLMTTEDLGFDFLCQDEREQLAETCAEFIKRKRDQPFFLVASFVNPHDICYMAIRDSMQNQSERNLIYGGATACATLDKALSRPAGIDDAGFFGEHCPPLPPNFEPQLDEPEAIRLMLEQRPFRMKARREWKDNRWREHRWAYARLTEMVDAQIARVLNVLRNSGQADRTVVIFTSDHGDMDSAHRLEHKSTLYEEACRIPLIIRPPGEETPGRVDRNRLVSNGLDILPTLCDYAGIDPPEGLLGRSLRPIAEGIGCDSWRQNLSLECAIGRAILTDRFKYAVYDVGANYEQLIDLVEDPQEMRNVLRDTHHYQVLENLRSILPKTFGGEQRCPDDVLKAMADA